MTPIIYRGGMNKIYKKLIKYDIIWGCNLKMIYFCPK